MFRLASIAANTSVVSACRADKTWTCVVDVEGMVRNYEKRHTKRPSRFLSSSTNTSFEAKKQLPSLWELNKAGKNDDMWGKATKYLEQLKVVPSFLSLVRKHYHEREHECYHTKRRGHECSLFSCTKLDVLESENRK
jgi:hypothetical protein